MFDGKAFGQEIVAATKSFVERSIAPIMNRLAEIERAVAARPAPTDEDALKAAIIADLERGCRAAVIALLPEAVKAAVDEAVAALPPPKEGEPGKSVTAEEIAPLLAAEVEKAVAALPRPKDGDPGKDADPALIETMVAEKVSEAVAAIPTPRDGNDADPEAIKAAVAEAVAAIPRPKDGESVTIEQVRPVIDEAVAMAVAAIPKPRDGDPGTSVTVADVAPLVADAVERAVAEIPRPKDGKDGKLPIVRGWSDRVHYEGDVVTHVGATFQAIRDTAKEPPHADWICLAAAGRDGRSFNARGLYDETGRYAAMDVVMLNGASFVARDDNPGPCPGDGWFLLAAQGKRGKPGEKGNPGIGLRGVPGSPVVSMGVDENGLLSLTNGDGSVVTCDLYPLLSKIG